MILVLEFIEVLASQLFNNCYNDLDIEDNDSDQMPFTDSENSTSQEDYDLNEFSKYCHLHNENLSHQLIKIQRESVKWEKNTIQLTFVWYTKKECLSANNIYIQKL